MPLYEYHCKRCRNRFEELTSSIPEGQAPGTCPKCGKADQTEKLFSRFAVAGQGDLRESTMHGCHGCYTGLDAGSGCGGGHCGDDGGHDHSD